MWSVPDCAFPSGTPRTGGAVSGSMEGRVTEQCSYYGYKPWSHLTRPSRGGNLPGMEKRTSFLLSSPAWVTCHVSIMTRTRKTSLAQHQFRMWSSDQCRRRVAGGSLEVPKEGLWIRRLGLQPGHRPIRGHGYKRKIILSELLAPVFLSSQPQSLDLARVSFCSC